MYHRRPPRAAGRPRTDRPIGSVDPSAEENWENHEGNQFFPPRLRLHPPGDLATAPRTGYSKETLAGRQRCEA
jgi:hypothetical protein